jgi:hypothetical protein
MRSWLASILVFLVSAPLLAQTAKPQTSTTTTTTTTTTAKPKAPKRRAAATPKAPAKPTTASEIKTLREAVSTQQQQIQMLRDELQRRDAAVQQMQQQLNSLQSTAQQAQSAAQAAEGCCKTNEEGIAALKTNVGTLQTTATATATGLQAAEKSIKELQSPLAIKYKGITITPGGFISANAIYRSKNQNLSNASSFAGMPFSGQPNSHLSELRLNARYSRLSLLAQGKFGGSNVQAYYEMDFEGAAQTANENITNSFTPRVREAWMNVDTPGGWSIAGGQTWSLITANRTGVGVRGLMLPAHIDASLVVGFHYARQGTFRVSKNFNKKVFVAFAVENPETVSTAIPAQFAGCTPPVAAGSRCLEGLQGSPGQPSATAPNGGFAAAISVDQLPDFAGKIAIEPGWGHFEVGAIGRFFRVRIANGALINTPNAGTNESTGAAAATFNAVLPIVPKKVDIVFASLFGQGIGRYGPGGGTDVTFKTDGDLAPIRGAQVYAGLEVHPNPKLDVLLYYGNEYYARTQYSATLSPTLIAGTTLPNNIGYGTIGSDLRGCRFEFPSGFGCSATTRDIYEITPGFWYRFYKGPAGTIQYGLFYSYTHRALWAGRVGLTPATASLTGAFPGIQNTVLSALRWYFP